jgi:hypothetical protein
MRVVWMSCSLVLLGLATGCSSRQDASSSRGPLFAGKLDDGTFWQKPLTSASNEGVREGQRQSYHPRLGLTVDAAAVWRLQLT